MYPAATASAAARAVLLGALGEPTPATRDAIENLAAGQRDDRAAAGVRKDALDASTERGERVASAVLRRAAADGFAGRNDRAYTLPTARGGWELAAPAKAPVEPFWGTLRPHVLDDARQFPAPTPPVYSARPDSAMGVQARHVYDTSRTLTDEQRDIARFWAPGPAARWMTIAADQVTARRLGLGQATRVLALTAISVADAGIAAWAAKYELHVIRPVRYIQRHIDPAWQPLLPTPGHPEWPAGHSAGAAAAATVLTAVLGDGPVTARDASGVEPERQHASFGQAADESATSRIYAGVHYPGGLAAGTEQGRRIGQLVLERAD